MKKKFSVEYLKEKDLPYSAIEETLIDNSRWSLYYEIIFEDGGKYWQTGYSCGATECQDEAPWEYETEVECVEVVKKPVTKEEWVPVKD